MLDQYKIHTNPVGHSVALSAIFAALPLLTLFVLLGIVRMKAWLAALISLAVALVVAVAVYTMPLGQAVLSASEGAAFGFFPILWIVLNAIWVYNLTVASGYSDVLRRSMERVSPDMRIQAIIIAFCFGALMEALAGFGTPVAITAVMLIALGFRPIHAASVALLANTAPVAFGALATPIVTLATVAHGANDDPRLTVDTLGSMVGRQTPVLALIVPLMLVALVDGRRGLRQAWPAAVTAGVAFAIGQFVASNYVSVPLTDIIASLVSALAVVLLVRVWRPVESPDLHAEQLAVAGGGDRVGAHRASGSAGGGYIAGEVLGGAPGERAEPPDTSGDRTGRDSGADVVRAYAPYLIIIVVFSIANLGPVKAALAKKPWAYSFHWPRLDVHTGDADAHLRHPHHSRPECRGGPGGQGVRRDVRRAEVGDRHRDGRAGAGLRAQPVRPDQHVERTAGHGRYRVRLPLVDPRLDRGRGDRLGHIVERAVRRPAGADRGAHRPGSGTAGRRQLLRRRDGQDDQPAEPGHRGRRGRHGRAGGRHLPQGVRVESRPAAVHVHPGDAAGHGGTSVDGAVGRRS